MCLEERDIYVLYSVLLFGTQDIEHEFMILEMGDPIDRHNTKELTE
jgi:hypothetical protein